MRDAFGIDPLQRPHVLETVVDSESDLIVLPTYCGSSS